jgi:hypothetical protein
MIIFLIHLVTMVKRFMKIYLFEWLLTFMFYALCLYQNRQDPKKISSKMLEWNYFEANKKLILYEVGSRDVCYHEVHNICSYSFIAKMVAVM